MPVQQTGRFDYLQSSEHHYSSLAVQKWPMARLQAEELVETERSDSSLQIAELDYFAHLLHCMNYPEPEGMDLREQQQQYSDEPYWPEPPISRKYYEREELDSELWLAANRGFFADLLEDFLEEWLRWVM